MTRSTIAAPHGDVPEGGVDGWAKWPTDAGVPTSVAPGAETRAARNERTLNHICNEFLAQEALPTTDGDPIPRECQIRAALEFIQGVTTAHDIHSMPTATLEALQTKNVVGARGVATDMLPSQRNLARACVSFYHFLCCEYDEQVDVTLFRGEQFDSCRISKCQPDAPITRHTRPTGPGRIPPPAPTTGPPAMTPLEKWKKV